MEMGVIEKMGFVDYFLIVFDIIAFAKKNGISIGPGRGSAVGSIVSYCLGITELEPTQYGLLFERFLNPERVTMPDNDIDVDPNGREAVIAHIAERLGADHISQINTVARWRLAVLFRTSERPLALTVRSIRTSASRFRRACPCARRSTRTRR